MSVSRRKFLKQLAGAGVSTVLPAPNGMVEGALSAFGKVAPTGAHQGLSVTAAKLLGMSVEWFDVGFLNGGGVNVSPSAAGLVLRQASQMGMEDFVFNGQPMAQSVIRNILLPTSIVADGIRIRDITNPENQAVFESIDPVWNTYLRKSLGDCSSENIEKMRDHVAKYSTTEFVPKNRGEEWSAFLESYTNNNSQMMSDIQELTIREFYDQHVQPILTQQCRHILESILSNSDVHQAGQAFVEKFSIKSLRYFEDSSFEVEGLCRAFPDLEDKINHVYEHAHSFQELREQMQERQDIAQQAELEKELEKVSFLPDPLDVSLMYEEHPFEAVMGYQGHLLETWFDVVRPNDGGLSGDEVKEPAVQYQGVEKSKQLTAVSKPQAMLLPTLKS